MNFFRKKNSAVINLESSDFGSDAVKLWHDLLFALNGHEVKHVSMRLYDDADLSMRVISVITSLALKLRGEKIELELVASTRTLQIMRRLNLAAAFSRTTEAT